MFVENKKGTIALYCQTLYEDYCKEVYGEIERVGRRQFWNK